MTHGKRIKAKEVCYELLKKDREAARCHLISG